MKKRVKAPLNDGVLYVHKNNAGKTDFGALKNIRTTADLELVGKLFFEEKTKRASDYEFAEKNDRTLNMKVRTLMKPIDTDNVITIGSTLYSIIYIDFDRSNGEMYIYMEEERELT